MCSCHSILECCVTFSGVKLSIRSFVLLLIRAWVFLWLHRPLKHRKKHDSQEAYFANGQALAVYLKMFKTYFHR